MAHTAVTAEELLKAVHGSANQRGYNVYSLSDPVGVSAVDRWNRRHSVTYERPIFSLQINERIDMARYSAMIFGVISSRMQRIGALPWNITKDSREKDEMMDKLSALHQIYQEWEDVDDPRAKMMRKMIVARVRHYMPDARTDLQNFRSALMRYKKRWERESSVSAEEVENWLQEPNPDYSFEEFLKQWVFDLHVHGTFAMYKDLQDGLVENLYGLPGGTVMPIQNRYVGGPTGYIQVVPFEAEPFLMFNDELSFSRWMPVTASPYGLVPLEALVNKVAEQMLFDERAANQADGTKPPEKIVVFGKEAPFGDLDKALEIPIDPEEQKRIETIMNEKRQEAIRTLSGYGTPSVVDLSRSEMFAGQSERQRQLREDVALTFGASNMEVNLTGSSETSGRSTSETEERQDMRRGVTPILKIIEEKINRDVLPFRFGPGYSFRFDSGLSDTETADLVTRKNKAGVWAVNEIREELGLDPFPEDKFDRPAGMEAEQDQQGEESENDNPLAGLLE